MVPLRSVALLEQAMRDRDINERELAHAARTSARIIAQMRTGERHRVCADIASRIESALTVGPGHLFRPGRAPLGASA